MLKEQRNEMLLGFEQVIHWVIARNMTLIGALGLERENVFQDLCVEAILALDRYDPERGASPVTYLVDMLQYAILNMKRTQRMHGMTGCDHWQEISFVPLNMGFDGRCIDAPSKAPYELVELKLFLSEMPENQQRLIQERVSGKYHRKKKDKTMLQQAMETILEGYVRECDICG